MLLSGDISCVTRDSNCCWSFAITATILPNLWFERMRVIFPEWNILAAKELFKFWRDHLQHCQNLIVYPELRRFCVEFLVEYRGPGPLPDLDITTPTTTSDVWRSNPKLEKNMQGFCVNATCFLADFFLLNRAMNFVKKSSYSIKSPPREQAKSYTQWPFNVTEHEQINNNLSSLFYLLIQLIYYRYFPGNAQFI